MMSSVFARGTKLYARIRNHNGAWTQVRTGFSVGDEEKAGRWAADRDREATKMRDAKGGEAGPLTLGRYVQTWLARRKTKTVKDDRTRLERHVVPRIGSMELVSIRPRHLRDLIEDLKSEGKLAPKTIREISGLLHTVFKSAVIDELVATNPVIYERGVLPKKVDKDPTWRAEAIFTRTEIEQIISDDRLPEYRRVIYALKFFTGRHGEVASMKWSQYDAATRPLGTVNLGKTKSGVPRAIPVHPTLAKILATWKLGGWANRYGRPPLASDLIVPTLKLKARKADEVQKQFVEDLAGLGLRVTAGASRRRRGHDLRRTLITLARSDGAIDGVLRLITHGPRAGDMLDLYSSPPWETLCTEMAKLNVRLLEGRVVTLTDSGILGAVLVQPTEPTVTANENERPRRDSNPCYLRERRVS